MVEKFEEFDDDASPLENSEDKKYREFQKAMDEVDRVMREIDDVFARTADRAEAEKIVLESLASLMDAAMKKSDDALREWLGALRQSEERETTEEHS